MDVTNYYTPIQAAMGAPAVNAEDDPDTQAALARFMIQNQQGQQDPQAQAPQFPAALAQQQAPQQPQQPQQPGLYDRFLARGDHSAISDGLINAGAAMLSAKNLQEGLGSAVAGFNGSYDAKLDKTKAENTPKVVPLQDGAFSMLVYPDGRQVVKKNSEVAQYVADNEQTKMQQQAQLYGFKQQAEQRQAEAKEGRKVSEDATKDMNKFDASLSKLNSLDEVLDRRDWMTQIQGNSLAAPIAAAIGTQGSKDNQRLAEVLNSEALAGLSQLKGASSDKELSFILKAVPPPSADKEVIREWKNRVVERVTALKQNAQAEYDHGQTLQGKGAPQAAPQQPQQPQAAPAASGAPAKVDQAGYAALPSGSLYVAPDGKTYRKK
jgi:hypothetical protein